MKRVCTSLLLGLVLLLSPVISIAAIYSSGQSAMWVRSGARNDSLEIDAVFFNPAGTTRLKDGFYFYFNHVLGVVPSGAKVTTTYELPDEMPLATYSGSMGLPDFKDEYPIESINYYWVNLYLDYKKGPWSFFFGFEPVGGSGGGEYPHGTPGEIAGFYLAAAQANMFGNSEYADPDNPDLLDTNKRITGFQVDNMKSKGGGGYLGPAVGAAYAINKYIAVAVKARYVFGFMRASGEYDVRYEITTQKNTADASAGTVTTVDKHITTEFGYNGHGWGLSGGISITPFGDKSLSIGITYDWFSEMRGMKLEYYSGSPVPSGPMTEGTKFYNQVPSTLRVGIGYYVFPDFKIALAYEQSFDRYAKMHGDVHQSGRTGEYDWDEKQEHGFKTVAGLGLEYTWDKFITASIGSGYTWSAYETIHQRDTSSHTDRISVHTGASVHITEDTSIHAGFCYFIGLATKGPETFALFNIPGRSTYYRYLTWTTLGITSRF